MKKPGICIALFIAAVFLTSLSINAQNTLRVSNVTGSNAPYSSIQAAINAASPGDIILVEGSQTDYATNISINKRVTIQGPGYLLNENTGIQFITYPATINFYGSVSFDPGGEGAAMYGMTPYTLAINAANVTVANCIMNSSIQVNDAGTGSTINGNIIYGGIGVSTNVGAIMISNNYTAIITDQNPAHAGIITNNIIFSGYSNLQNCTVTNNIFLDGSDPLTITNCVVSNNIFASPSSGVPDADATNYFGLGYSDLFVGTTGYTTDTQYMLKPGSVAVGGGTGGVDIGIYGGNTAHYRPSGIRPGQPTITSLTTPGTVPQNGTLNVKVSAKVN